MVETSKEKHKKFKNISYVNKDILSVLLLLLRILDILEARENVLKYNHLIYYKQITKGFPRSTL